MDNFTELDKKMIRRTIEIARSAVKNGCHPFGALLADKGGNILMEQENAFTEGGSAYHAETLLALKAAKKYTLEELSECTLYTNFEPCCMCTGAIYWTGIGRLVYGASEKSLLEFTGDNRENPTFDLSSREVLSHGQKKIEVNGPTEDRELLREICLDHIEFWKNR